MYRSSSSTLLIEQNGPILYVKFNRPASFNALNYELIMATKQVLQPVEEDWEIRAVVFQGQGSISRF